MPYFDDKLGCYEKFRDYCEKNGLKVNFEISTMICSFMEKRKK